MATTTESSLLASSIGVAVELCARSTLTLFWSMGVMTMKMISNTSMTSTIGVTLMLALTLAPSFRVASDILCSVDRISSSGAGGIRRREPSSGLSSRPQDSRLCEPAHRRARRDLPSLPPVALLDEVVDQLAGGVVHLDVERLHAIGEIVEEPHRRDGHEEAEGRGDEGFRNTAGH